MADPLSIGLMVGSMALSTVGTFAQIGAANQAAEAEYEAAHKTLLAQYEEADRQAEDLRNQTQEDISDRVRAANREMATARVVLGEQGLSGSSMNRAIAAVAYAERTDISRLKYGYDQGMDSIHAQKVSGHVNFGNRVTAAQNRRNSTVRSSYVNLASNVLQIGGRAYGQTQEQRAATNVTQD